MDPSVQIALIVATFGFAGPVALSAATHLLQRREKLQDYARQDEVAARVNEVAETAASGLKTTISKIDSIHTLVNSQMTALMESELAVTQRLLPVVRELMGLKAAAGHHPSPEALGEISAIESKIAELKAKISDRFDPS